MDQFWLALILGLIAGWLVEWLIDWAYWRPQVRALRAENADLRRRLVAGETESAVLPDQGSGAER